MHVKYIVELSESERSELEAFVRSGSKLVRKVERAQILLAKWLFTVEKARKKMGRSYPAIDQANPKVA